MSTAYYELVCQEDIDVGTAPTSKRNPGGGTLTATQVGIHTFAVGKLAATKTWNPGAIAADESVQTTITVAGAALGDFVFCSLDTIVASPLILGGTVSVANTVSVTLRNASGTIVTPASGTLRVLVLKSA